jgi:hypothetical protein
MYLMAAHFAIRQNYILPLFILLVSASSVINITEYFDKLKRHIIKYVNDETLGLGMDLCLGRVITSFFYHISPMILF